MEKWQWNKSNGLATDEQTQLSYEVLVGHKLIIDFHHLVWNDLVNFINKLIESKGKIWNNTILDLESTKMTDSDTILTAKRFNALYTQLEYSDWSWKIDDKKEGYIGDRLFIGSSDNEKPDGVYGYYFLEVVEIANNLINN